MPIDAVIFDMDGVIVESEDYWLASRIEWAERHGKLWTMEFQRAAMGRNTAEWAEIMRERLELPDMPLETVMDEVMGLVLGRLEARLPVLPGALEAVHTAASRYPVALASGSPIPIIQRVMELTGLDKVFQAMVYGDDQPRGKPFPDVYLETARLLGVQPERCVGIEDSINGIKSLHAAGMKIIAVPSPSFPLPDEIRAMADVQLDSLQEFSLGVLETLDK